DIAEQVDALHAAQSEPWRPEEVARVPGRLGEVAVGETLPSLQHPDPIALLGQPQRGDAAPEPRADHDDVEVSHVPQSGACWSKSAPVARRHAQACDGASTRFPAATRRSKGA